MADFKIKSAAGAGNKTLIQGQDQSGSNYAIELGDSGALKLGTITSGTFPEGMVLRVLSNVTSVETSITSSTFAAMATGPSITITPASSTNKILILGSTSIHPATDHIYVDISRSISGGATTHNLSGETGGFVHQGTDEQRNEGSITFLDSPSTTSAITYKFAARNGNNSTTVYFGHASIASTITVMEIQHNS